MKRLAEKSTIVIWPNSLFYHADLSKYDSVTIIEEPIYFGVDSKYNINKIKLAYLRASMQRFYDTISSSHRSVHYIELQQVGTYDFLKPFSVSIYDPVDFALEDKLKRAGISYLKVPTLLFLTPLPQIQKYFESKKGKKMIHSHFYQWNKGRLDVLSNEKSHDKDNQKSLPKNHNFTFKTPKFDKGEDEKYYNEAIAWVNEHELFKNNLGSAEKLHLYPISPDGAQLQFNDFLEHRVENFGTYEDAIDADNVVLFHSFISAPLNNGLLSPKWVLDKIMDRKNIPMNSLEGFVRQLIGWREYQRGIYSIYFDEIRVANHFESTKKLDWDYWHGKKLTGIPLLDNEIKKAIKYGFAHHIPRLCVFLNMFVLLEIDLHEIVKWFMEVVSMDAYPWVMYSNIASMGYFDTRFMQKPYVTTSAYLLKMSNYPKGDWCEIWNCLFYRFLAKKKTKLVGGAAVYLRNLQYFQKKTDTEKSIIIEKAEAFQRKVAKSD